MDRHPRGGDPLRPLSRSGTALVMDIADLTDFSARHSPDHVIATFDSFLSDAATAVSVHKGVVISYPVVSVLPDVPTQRAATARSDFRSPEDLSLRGIAQPVAVCALTGFRADPGRNPGK